jgi:hypothetical protein
MDVHNGVQAVVVTGQEKLRFHLLDEFPEDASADFSSSWTGFAFSGQIHEGLGIFQLMEIFRARASVSSRRARCWRVLLERS